MAEQKPELPVVFDRMPPDREERDRIHAGVAAYVTRHALVPPLSLGELTAHAEQVTAELDIRRRYRDWVTVAVSNEVWRETLAAVPHERRIVLLPNCLRDRSRCPARMDELGLLCESCGRCPTGELQDLAEGLGSVVLVAEGTTVVTQLIESGQVDAVIGVSCLPTLRRSFPYMTAAAVPGLAIPLVVDGCDGTLVDVDRVRAAIAERSDRSWAGRLDLDLLRAKVNAWFTPEALEPELAREGTETERQALAWVSSGGKRWRPFLTAAVASALTPEGSALPASIPKLALAVECFHKASLAHDDIEDGDLSRYGTPTLHVRHGVPIALNLGDLLVGEGYRLISESGDSAETVAAMLRVAAGGHRELCLGQGEELAWSRSPRALRAEEALEVFRRKTSPAFHVALGLGAVAAGGDDELVATLAAFSDALGIAYQIRDDIEDATRAAGNDIGATRPSLLVALAMDRADRETVRRLEALLACGCWADGGALVRDVISRHELEREAWQLYEAMRDRALRTLAPIKIQRLKSLLYQVVSKVLGDPEADRPVTLADDRDEARSAADIIPFIDAGPAASSHG